MNMKKLQYFPWHIVVNLAIAYICFEALRLAFLAENWSFYDGIMTWGSFGKLSKGGLLFDTSAICFINALYLVLALLPFARRSHKLKAITKWAYVLPNTICIVASLMDSVYFSYTQRRVTADVFAEFEHENNLSRIIGIELLSHWYFILLAIALVLLLYFGYRQEPKSWKSLSRKGYVGWKIALLALLVPLTLCGMRGAWFHTSTRPISMNEVFRFADQPVETAIVLNTPFSILKTMGHKAPQIPEYFSDQSELDKIYSPLHLPKDSVEKRKKNVVVLIVESFAQEFIGSRNRQLDNGTYKGYTPFADSLLTQSLTWEETFCNSWTSIDAMPAVLASIPKMRDSFVLSTFSVNKINSLASELKNWGYQTAFFHGAENQSMGFHAFAQAAGYEKYYGQDEFYADPRFGGRAEFDGTWGVWDEPFLQFFCAKMDEMSEPFFTSVFTLSSHHPFAVPEKYKDKFLDEGIHQLHKCIKYTDYSLKKFFESASKRPWFKNTIFVLCADHASSKTTHAEYKTEVGHYRIPIIFYDPSGEMPTGCHEGIAQQIDIMPTLLGYLGYDRPYVAFGKNLLETAPEDTWAVNWQQTPMLIKGDYALMFDGNQTTAVYDYRKDPLLKHNLKDQPGNWEPMVKQLKAIMQSYMDRMKNNQVIVR